MPGALGGPALAPVPDHYPTPGRSGTGLCERWWDLWRERRRPRPAIEGDLRFAGTHTEIELQAGQAARRRLGWPAAPDAEGRQGLQRWHSRQVIYDGLDPILVGLHSEGPEARIRALRAVCPCRAGFQRYQRYMDEAHRLQKDPVPAVREAALHIQVDAIGLECIERRRDRTGEHQGQLLREQRERRRREEVLRRLRARSVQPACTDEVRHTCHPFDASAAAVHVPPVSWQE